MLTYRARSRKSQDRTTPRLENPETVEFFRQNPLPREYHRYRRYIYRLPLHLVDSFVSAGRAAGSTDAQIGKAFKRAVEFEESDPHRCSACFAWEKEEKFIPTVSIIRGEFRIFAVCDSCMAKIKDEQTTNDFWKNIAAHGLQGEVEL